jgi:tellurite resistance protein TehA-like permease
MSYKEKNTTVTLVNFSLILVFLLFRIFQMVRSESFNAENVFRLWGIVIVLTVIVTVAATVLTIIVSAVIEAAKTGGKEEPEIDSLEDERDKLIDLKGTKVTYFVTSIGGLIAMLTFVLGQPPLVMFTLFILFGVLAQIVGDIFRLALYRRGF